MMRTRGSAKLSLTGPEEKSMLWVLRVLGGGTRGSELTVGI